MCIFPAVLGFPYFKLYTYEEAVRKTGIAPMMIKDGTRFEEAVTAANILLPTANVVNYFNGKFKGPFSDADVIRKEEAGRSEFYNQEFIRD